jgi:hypothetical protein
MAHFAKLNHLGIVIDVNVVDDQVLLDETGHPNEQTGIEWLRQWSGGHELWVQTSYNTVRNQHRLGGTPFRLNYAMKGGTYDKVRDAFIEWHPNQEDVLLDEEKGAWVLVNYVNAPQDPNDTAEYPQPNVDRSTKWDWDTTNWTWIKVPRN